MSIQLAFLGKICHMQCLLYWKIVQTMLCVPAEMHIIKRYRISLTSFRLIQVLNRTSKLQAQKRIMTYWLGCHNILLVEFHSGGTGKTHIVTYNAVKCGSFLDESLSKNTNHCFMYNLLMSYDV